MDAGKDNPQFTREGQGTRLPKQGERTLGEARDATQQRFLPFVNGHTNKRLGDIKGSQERGLSQTYQNWVDSPHLLLVEQTESERYRAEGTEKSDVVERSYYEPTPDDPYYFYDSTYIFLRKIKGSNLFDVEIVSKYSEQGGEFDNLQSINFWGENSMTFLLRTPQMRITMEFDSDSLGEFNLDEMGFVNLRQLRQQPVHVSGNGKKADLDFEYDKQTQTVLMTVSKGGEVQRKMCVPMTIYTSQIKDKLTATLNLEDPYNEDWLGDRSWREADLAKVIGIKEIPAKI